MVIVKRSVHRSPERMQQQMEQVFRALMPGHPQVSSRSAGMWRPALEVYETEESLVVTAEIAGMDEQSLHVVVEGDVLSIRGERPDRRERERRLYREAGVPYGAFGADVFLPFPIDVDRAEAEYGSGFLRITLPRVAARTIVPRRLVPEQGPGQEGR